MTRDNGGQITSQDLWIAILSDLHFWIPVIVLLGGLAVLRWIS